MKETVTLLLNIARKSYMGADFKQAAMYAEQAKANATGRDWIECQKFLIGTSRELLESAKLEPLKAELQRFLITASDDLKAPTTYLLAQLFAYRHEWAIAKNYVEQSLDYSLEQQNNLDLAYALFGVAMIDAYQGHLPQAMDHLHKLATLLANHPRVEIEISALMLKIYIQKKQKNWDAAIEITWACYELAKKSGYYLYLPMVLSNLASLHIDKNALNEAQFYFSLAAKGVTKEQQPFLYYFFESEKKRFSALAPASDFDLIVDTRAKTIQERIKGTVDFRNQHTLLDLALLFLKNPDCAFSKSDLIEKVWGLKYDPTLHDNLIYVTIKRLRSLLEPSIDSPRYILRNRSGYYFDNSNSLLFKNEDASA